MTTENKLPREIADRVARVLGRPAYPPLVDAIEAALNARDERAAMICETGAMLASPDGVIPAGDPEHERLQSLASVLNKAAAAIRGNVTTNAE